MSDTEIIRTQRLELVDSKGEVRGIFTTTPEGKAILSVRSQKVGLALVAAPDGEAGLFVQPSGSPHRFELSVFPTGEPSLNLRDAGGNVRITLGVSDEDGPISGIMDEQGEIIWNWAHQP